LKNCTVFYFIIYISKQILQYKYHDLQNHKLIIVWKIILKIKRIGNIKNPNLSNGYKMWIILYYKICVRQIINRPINKIIYTNIVLLFWENSNKNYPDTYYNKKIFK